MAFRTFDAPPETAHKSHKPSKPTVTPAAVFLVMLFVITMLILQGRAFYDVNRLFNLDYSACVGDQGMTDACNEYYYYWNRALTWSYVSVPLLAGYLILSLVLRKKKTLNWQKAFYRAFIFLTFVDGAVIFTYASMFLFRFHRMLAWYVMFGTAAVLLVSLIIFIDKKNRKKNEPEEGEDH